MRKRARKGITMKTMIFDINDDIDVLIDALLHGKVGAMPCDTIYGLSAIANEKTSERIFELKKRPQNKNLITLTDFDHLDSGLIVPEVLHDIWPAPLTAILARKDGGKTVAVRIPADPFILEVVKSVGPIWSTSCNISGQPSLNSFDEIVKVFGGEADFIVKKEMRAGGMASTLVDFTSVPWRVLRQGAFDFSPFI